MSTTQDLSGMSTQQLLALHSQLGDDPPPAAPPAPDPTIAAAGPGAYRDPNYPRLVRNQDGSIYGIGDFGADPEDSGGPGINISVDGSTDPQAIQSFLKAHPDASPPPPAATGGPGAPAAGLAAPATAAPASAPPAPAQGEDGDVASMTTQQLLALHSQLSGDPNPNSPQGKALASARGVAATTSGPVRSALGGFMFGLNDELSGAEAYAGKALRNAVVRAGGGVPQLSATDAYNATVQAEREANAAYTKSHPISSLAAGAVGSLVNPINLAGGEFIGGAPTLASTLGRSTLVGAGTGAAYGFGEGDGPLSTRAREAFSGGVAGAEAGLATPILGEALGWAGRGLGIIGGSRQAQAARQVVAGRQTLGRMGIDYDAMPAPAQDQVAAHAASGRLGSDAAVQAAAHSLPVPVPLSLGQLTGDPAQQLEENLALRGARGQPAQIVARGFKAQQQDALRGNVQQIAGDLGGGLPAGRGQAGEAVSDALNARYDTAKARVSSAYDTARSAPSPAYLEAGDAHRLVTAVRGGLKDFDPLNVPRVAREVDRLAQAAVPWESQLPPGVNAARIGTVAGQPTADVRALFEARARLSKLRSTNDPVEGAAASTVLRAFDDHLANAVAGDLFKGDPETVGLWKKAIGERAEFGRVFQSDDLIHRLTERAGFGGNARLKVDPHDASNYIFGRSNLGFVGRQKLYRGLTNLRLALGSDSGAWNRIRSEAFSRIAQAGEGTVEGGTPQFSGAKFASAWTKAKSEDPKLIGALFRPEEVATVDRFAAVANLATKPVTGGDNSSNTAVAQRALRGLKRLPFVAIESIPFIDHFADKIDNAARSRAITKATSGAMPRPAVPTYGATAARFATPGTSQLSAEMKRRQEGVH